MTDSPESLREASYTSQDKFFGDDALARKILSAVAETRLEQTPSGNVSFPTAHDSFADQSSSSVPMEGDKTHDNYASLKASMDVIQHLSPKKGKLEADAGNNSNEHSNRSTLSPNSSPRRRQQGNMADLEYCEDLVVATAVYDNTTVDSDEEGYLPTCIEYDPDAKPTEYWNTFYKRMFYAFVIVTLVMIVVIVAAVKLVKGNTNEMEWMRQEAETLLGSKMKSVDESYRNALGWMMYDDPHRFELSKMPTGDSGFHQRFFLTYFYFATSVNTEWAYCAPGPADDPYCLYRNFVNQIVASQGKEGFRWLSDSHTCQWAGVECNANKEIEGIRTESFKLSGTFPDGLQYLSTLKTISLVDSNLQGQLPPDILRRLPQLTSLFLGVNQFTGSIPAQWFIYDNSSSSQNSSALANLELNMNMLTGTIPTEIADLINLEVLSLNNNVFEGTIPKEMMGGMPSLKNVHLSMNQLTGTIPSSIGQLTNLYLLAATGNKLQGTIPTEIGLLNESLGDIQIGSNNFSGNLPKEFYDLKYLMNCDLSKNRFNGTLRPTIGRSFPLLEILYVNQNEFTGSIPDQMESMMYLSDFVFTDNDLTGTIPEGGLCQFVSERCCKVTCCTVDGDICPTNNV